MYGLGGAGVDSFCDELVLLGRVFAHGELPFPTLFSIVGTRLAIHADGDDGPLPDVVVDRDGTMGEVQIIAHNRKARPDAADVALHRLDR